MINVACLSGNLTDKPRKFGTEENPGIGFTLAVNVPVKVDGEWGEDTMFVSCSMFGKRVVKLSEYLHKGTPVAVSGSVKPERYDTKDGIRVNGFGIIVSGLQLPPKPKDAGNEKAPWRL